ncbi:hypothetical protein [Shinella sp. M27]|uniref:hypothetical protein n=1 Tax=Shinella sp. M27 TaxID=3368614 RepID=UPI003BA390B2
MNWIVWGIVAFVILCGACALAFEWAGRDDERNEYSGAVEGDQLHFNRQAYPHPAAD